MPIILRHLIVPYDAIYLRFVAGLTPMLKVLSAYSES